MKAVGETRVEADEMGNWLPDRPEVLRHDSKNSSLRLKILRGTGKERSVTGRYKKKEEKGILVNACGDKVESGDGIGGGRRGG